MLDEKFGENTLELIGSMLKNEQTKIEDDEEDNVFVLLGTLINELIKTFEDEIYLVLDDYHILETESNNHWLNKCINYLFENIPQNLHLIITTRAEPEFNLSRLRAKRMMYEVNSDSLSFNKEEVTEVFGKIYSLKLSEKDFNILNKISGGWITGIHLILQLYGEKIQNLESLESSVPENVFNYFANEIFLLLEKEVQTFLLQTSLLDDFTDELCDSILEITCSKKIIDRLISKNIFIQHYQTNAYGYFPLFKNFLTEKLSESKTQIEIREIYNKAAEFYFQKAEVDSAIKYFLKAENYEESIRHIAGIYASYLESNKVVLLWSWVNQIPEELINQNPVLMFLKGKLLKLFSGDLESSLNYIERTLKILKSEQDMDFNICVECVIIKADILLLNDKVQPAMKELLALEKRCHLPEHSAMVYYNIGRIHYHIGEFDEAIAYFNRSQEISVREKFVNLLNKNLLMLGSLNYLRGEFVKSIYYSEQVNLDSLDVYSKAKALFSLIFVNSYSGNYQKAKQLLDESREMLSVYAVAYFELALLYVEAKLKNIAGDYEDSIILLEKVLKIAFKLNRKYYIYPSYMLLVEDYYCLNKTDTAMQYYELCGKYKPSDSEAVDIFYDSYKTIIDKKIKPDASIAKKLTNALKYNEANNLFLEAAQMYFHLADYYFKIKSYDKAKINLESYLQIASDRQYIPLVENKLYSHRKLFDFAIENDIHSSFIKEVTEKMFSTVNLEWLSDECKKRLNEQTENFYDISMTSIGELSFKVRGEIIKEEKWKRKKSKVILAYLVLNPNIKLTKDQAVELFFPELPMEKAEPLFHNALNNIRNVFKGDEESFSPEYLLYENKILSLNPNYYYKSDAALK